MDILGQAKYDDAVNREASNRLLQVMDEVHTIVSGGDDIQEVLEQLLERMLTYLQCDRAWLLYPCDPATPTWRVPMERTLPEWPGAFAQDLEIEMVDGVRFVFEAALASADPVTFDAGSELQVSAEVSEQFGVRAQMILGVHPKTDRPWMLGVHHCAQDHVFTAEDKLLFASIGRRLGDSLSTLIALRDLRVSEAGLERAVAARTAELERANAALQAFGYSVSHDLRAPIRAVRGFTQLLSADFGEQLGESGQRYISRSLAACDNMDGLIDALLALSRATSEPLRRESVDLSALASEVVSGLRFAEPSRSVALSIQPDLVAQCDPTLTRIALENLLGNSWKYSAREDVTRIDFAQAPSPSGAESQAQPPTFLVRDNGVGFDPAHQDKLFQAFERLHGRSEFPGAGVGLATVARVIDRHDGRVWAEGAPGGGATFYFTLGGATADATADPTAGS